MPARVSTGPVCHAFVSSKPMQMLQGTCEGPAAALTWQCILPACVRHDVTYITCLTTLCLCRTYRVVDFRGTEQDKCTAAVLVWLVEVAKGTDL